MALALSFSQISTYLECPYQYFLLYIIGLPTKPKSYFSLGKSIHTALEKYHKPRLIPSTGAIDELLSYFENAWISEGYANEIDETRAKEDGKSILSSYYDRLTNNPANPIEVEKRFNVTIDGLQIKGVIDRIDEVPSGGLHIIDYKTGNFVPDLLDENSKLQLSIYTLAVNILWDKPVERASYLYLRSGTDLDFEPKDDDLFQTRLILKAVSEGIGCERFQRKTNKFCRFCDFYETCQKSNVISVKGNF